MKYLYINHMDEIHVCVYIYTYINIYVYIYMYMEGFKRDFY